MPASRRAARSVRGAARILRAVALVAATAIAVDARAMPGADLAIVGARLYAAPDAAAVDDATVLVRDGRIVAVGAHGTIVVPRGTTTLDAHGAVVTAGFWNNHIHLLLPDLLNAQTKPAPTLAAALGAMLVRWGFTTVFDLASGTDNTLTLRRRIESGEVPGPMILTVGDPFFPKGGTPIYVRDFLAANGFPNEEVDDPGEAATRAARQMDAGTDGVKLFTGAIVGGTIGVLPMRVDVAKAVVDEARRRGKPSFAHPTNRAGLDAAVDAGVEVLAHTTEDGPWSPSLIATLRARRTALIPTLTLFDDGYRQLGADGPALAAKMAGPIQQVHDFAAAGGTILFGTDVGYTDVFDTADEYRLMAAALDWRAILASLTTAPAAHFGFGDRKGRVETGMDGDLVVLDGDPAVDPNAFARVRETVRAGRIVFERGSR